jgi:hypothetical protein
MGFTLISATFIFEQKLAFISKKQIEDKNISDFRIGDVKNLIIANA